MAFSTECQGVRDTLEDMWWNPRGVCLSSCVQGLSTTVVESNLSEFLLNLLKTDIGWTREHFPTLDGPQAIVQADTVQLATTEKIEMSNRPYLSSIPLARFVALILFSVFLDRQTPPLSLYTITRDPIFLGIPLHPSSRSSAGTLLQP
jgi:hypothetical protein